MVLKINIFFLLLFISVKGYGTPIDIKEKSSSRYFSDENYVKGNYYFPTALKNSLLHFQYMT